LNCSRSRLTSSLRNSALDLLRNSFAFITSPSD
jgi:hypothetical protein